MGFLSGLFSDKKKTDSNSSQSGTQEYGLSPQVKSYWDTIAPQFQAGWSPVGDNRYQTQAAQAQAGYASGLNPAFSGALSIGQTGIDPASIARFQNPWEDQVVRDTLSDMRYADAQALTQSNAAAAKMGALGGTGGIVRRNLAEQNFEDARNKAITGIRAQGFNTAADLAGKSTQAQLSGLGAASGIAGQQGALTNQLFGQGTQLWNQGWQNALMPFQIGQQGAQTLTGLAGASGQNTTGTAQGTQTVTGTPSLFSIGTNLFGAALAGGWKPFADGGAVSGHDDTSQSKSDPHAKFKSAFEAITGLISKARGGSVSGMKPAHADGGSIGSWSTTVTPASTFDTKAFGQGLQKMGQQGQGEQNDTSLLQQQQQSLSGMLSGMMRRASGGSTWDETGPEFGASSGLVPPMRLGAAPDRVERRAIPPPPELSRITAPGGAAFSVAAPYATRFSGLLKDLEDAGYPVRGDQSGGYNPRMIAGTNTPSHHAYGRAIDVNWTDNPRGKSGTIPAALARDLAAKYGMKWGGDWKNPDPMHFEIMGEPSHNHGGETAPVRVASAADALLSSPVGAPREAPVVTDAPKRGGWFSDGIWSGEKMTPMQRLGIGLMSVRGPMFGGPLNDMAKQLMAMEEGRLNEKRVDNQADQFAKQIAQQAAIAAGRLPDGTPTVQSRQVDASIANANADRRIREAAVTGAYDGKPTVAGRMAESNLATAEMAREMNALKLEEAKHPERAVERRKELADKYGLTGDQRTQYIFDGKIPDRAAATETTEQKEVAKASVESAQKDIQSAKGAKDSLKFVDELYQIAKDPNLEGAVGSLDQYSLMQTVGKAVPFNLFGTNPELHAKISRIQQQLTLAGGEKMKGLGAQSDADAARLENAISNLTSARDKKEFMGSLAVIEDGISSGYNRGVMSARKYPKIADEIAKAPLRDLKVRQEARDAIAEAKRHGKDIRNEVIQRLIQNGIDPGGI